MTASIIWIDGQSHYTNVLHKWVAKSTVAPTVGAYGKFGNGLLFTANNGCFVDAGLFTPQQDWSFGFFLKIPSLTNVSGLFLLYDNVGSVTHLSSFVTSSGQIVVRLGDGGGTTIATSGTNYLSADTWYYIEFKLRIDDSVGYVRCRINGTSEWITLTGADTRNGGTTNADYFRWGYTSGGVSDYTDHWMSDIWIQNGTDADYLGIRRVITDFPSGAGTNSAWTPSTGSNYACVDETPPDTADYVTSKDTSKKDTYAFPALEEPVGVINAVALTLHAKKDDVNPRSLGGLLLLSGTELLSSGSALTTSYVPYQKIFPLAPGGTAWDVTKVNACECGEQLTV